MASGRFEFWDDEQELMWETYSYLVEKFKPRAPKPPQRNAAGRWHFYLENPAQKRKKKEQEKDNCAYRS